MAGSNNIKIGNNIVTANANSSMAVFSADDTAIIRSEVNGNYVSYQPGRQINSLASIQQGKGYILISKTARSLPLFEPSTGAFEPAVFSSIFNT